MFVPVLSVTDLVSVEDENSMRYKSMIEEFEASIDGSSAEIRNDTNICGRPYLG